MHVRTSQFASLSLLGVVVILHLLTAGGCATRELQVVPHPGPKLAVLSPEEVVTVMRRAWFSDEQIKEAGAELRDALAFHGAARIRCGEHTQALFLVDGDFIYVVVRGRDGFFYDRSKGGGRIRTGE